MENTSRLAGKVAIVTGSSQGIGQSIAERFAKEGASIVIDYRDHAEGANETRKLVEAAGGEAVIARADISSIDDIQGLVDAGVKAFGKIDILVNNAGIEKRKEFWEVTEQEYDAVMEVNLKGAFFATQRVVRHLLETKRPGRIINVSSVNSVAPGAIETPINRALLNDPSKLRPLMANIPLQRLGQPGDVAEAALFLASEGASYITGTTLFVDGGLLWNYHEQ
jgi:glucose 1-dehydrogenase